MIISRFRKRLRDLANVVGVKQGTCGIQLFYMYALLSKMLKHGDQTIVFGQIGSFICLFETNSYRTNLSVEEFYISCLVYDIYPSFRRLSHQFSS